jgi:hypothetical protein
MKSSSVCYWFLNWLILWPWRWRQNLTLKHHSYSNGLNKFLLNLLWGNRLEILPGSSAAVSSRRFRLLPRSTLFTEYLSSNWCRCLVTVVYVTVRLEQSMFSSMILAPINSSLLVNKWLLTTSIYHMIWVLSVYATLISYDDILFIYR